jgi:hypothetical protein
LQVTFRHFLNARVRVWGSPGCERNVVFERAVTRWTMVMFLDEPQGKMRAAIAGHGEPDGVGHAIFGEAGTVCGVSQIAMF